MACRIQPNRVSILLDHLCKKILLRPSPVCAQERFHRVDSRWSARKFRNAQMCLSRFPAYLRQEWNPNASDLREIRDDRSREEVARRELLPPAFALENRSWVTSSKP